MRRLQHPSVDQRAAEEAALWLIELEEGIADAAQFAAWLEASPRHVEEFLLASALWNAADGIDPERRIDVQQLARDARGNVQPIDIELSAPSAYEARRPSRVGRRFAAVVAVVALASSIWVGVAQRGIQYKTAVGEQRTIKLPDGSIVSLNTHSRIALRFRDKERVVVLSDGEALFEVAHDTARPFRVVAGQTVVQAVGTQFDVNHSVEGTTVSVVEGVVRVVPANSAKAFGPDSGERVSAGEQAQLSPQGALLHHANAEIARVMAWRERRLIFRDEALAAVAAEFNRYNNTQLIIEGAATRARRMTGVFNADDPHALVAFLERDATLSLQTRGGSIVIRGP